MPTQRSLCLSLVCGLATASLFACVVDRRASLPPIPFTSEAELDAIAAIELETMPEVEPAGVRVDRWTLAGPLPETTADGEPIGDDTAAQLARRLGAPEGRRASLAMSCFAREYGRFHVARGAGPTAALHEFMLRRCGVVIPDVRISITERGEGAEARTAEELASGFPGLAAGPVGAWVGERDGRQVAVVVEGPERLELEPLTMAATQADGRVDLRGRLGAREWIHAAVTHGPYGVAACLNLSAEPGAFHIVCPVDRSDSSATVDISAAAPGRVLGYVRARVWLSPDGSLPSQFEDPAWSRTAAPLDPGEDLRSASLEVINGLRERLGVDPLEHVSNQSARFDELLPHFLAAQSSNDVERMDSIALGLLAGHRLSARVVSGSFHGGLAYEAIDDRRHLLEALLLSPSARLSLLASDLDLVSLAVSPAAGDAKAYGYFATWARAGDLDDDGEEWVFDLVDVARARAGKPDMYRIGGSVHDRLAESAARVGAGELNYKEGLNRAMSEIVDEAEVPIRGYVALLHDLRTLEVPPELMRDDTVQMAVNVAQIPVADSAWDQTLVYIAFVYDSDLPEAKR